MRDTEIFEALEELSRHCPWEECDIWVKRTPAGQTDYSAYARGVDKLGIPSAWGSGKTPGAAVATLKHCYPQRDPEQARKQKIAELEIEIQKLKQLSFVLPPWRPRKELTVGGDPDPEPQAPAEPMPPRYINVDTTVDLQ